MFGGFVIDFGRRHEKSLGAFLFELKLKPCPFGLIKRLDPIVVIFSKNVKKITSVGSSAFQKNLQRLDQPALVFFLEMKKF